MVVAIIGAGEERVLPVKRKRADGALDRIAVQLDAAVVQEAGQPLATGERVADRLGKLRRGDIPKPHS